MNVRVYYADTAPLTDERVFAKYYETATPERRTKVDRIHSQSDRIQSLAAGALLQAALSDLGLKSTPDRPLRFAVNEYGKPYLVDYPQVHFNLSHSGERVMCAVWDREVGCDVERIRTGSAASKAERVAKYFTYAERAWLASKDTTEHAEEKFFRLWTLKESYVKAVGKGLAIPLNSFEIVFNPQGQPQFGTDGLEENSPQWTFHEYDSGDGYCCSVCADCGPDSGPFEEQIHKIVFS